MNWSDFCLTIFHFIQELYIVIELLIYQLVCLSWNGFSLFKWIWNLYHREVLGSFAGLCSSDSVYFVFSRWRQSVWKSTWLGKTLASTLFQTALGLSMNQGIDKHWIIIVVMIMVILLFMRVNEGQKKSIFGPQKGHFGQLGPQNGPPSGQTGTYRKTEGIQSYLRIWRSCHPIESGPSEPKGFIGVA